MVLIFIVTSVFFFMRILNNYIAIRVCKERIFNRGCSKRRDIQHCVLRRQKLYTNRLTNSSNSTSNSVYKSNFHTCATSAYGFLVLNAGACSKQNLLKIVILKVPTNLQLAGGVNERLQAS